MKKLVLAATGIVLGLALLGVTAFTGSTAEAAQNHCKVTADVPNIGTKIDKDRKWTQKDGRAYIVAVVHGKGCKMPVSVASWKAPDADGRPFNEQVFFKGHSKVLDEGRHLMSVDKPECYFQVDLAHGLNPHPGGKRGPHYGDLFIAGAIGGNKKCKMPAVACKSLTVAPLGRTSFRMTGRTTIENGAGVRAYIFTVTRNGQVVGKPTEVRTHNEAASFVYKQTKPGTYKVNLKVRTSEGEKTSPACNATFTVKAVTPGKIEVCEKATGQIKEIFPNEMSDKYTTDLSQCVPAGETPDTPTPSVLPNTGAGAVVAIFSGVSTLAGAIHWAISRRFFS